MEFYWDIDRGPAFLDLRGLDRTKSSSFPAHLLDYQSKWQQAELWSYFLLSHTPCVMACF